MSAAIGGRIFLSLVCTILLEGGECHQSRHYPVPARATKGRGLKNNPPDPPAGGWSRAYPPTQQVLGPQAGRVGDVPWKAGQAAFVRHYRGYCRVSREDESGLCTECEANTFSHDSGQTTCEECTTGTSNRGSSYCSDCAAGTQLSSEPKECEPCDEGTISDVGGTCTKCPAGTFEVGRHQCEPCPPGTWSAAEGAFTNATCTPCKTGSYSSASEADAADKCNACPPGKHGKTSGAASSTDCIECEANTFSRDSGQTTCEECTTGTSSLGSSYCSDCAAGTQLSSEPKKCVPCDEGMVSSVGDECTNCPAGTFEVNHLQCEPCPPGTWSAAKSAFTNATCTPCKKGSFSSASGVDSADKCNACPPGRRSDTEGIVTVAQCKPCQSGFFAEISGQSECNACLAGNTSDRGSPTCKECPSGMYLAASTASAAAACTVCPPGTHALYGATSCTPCEPGTIAPNSSSTVCAVCGIGKFELNRKRCVDCSHGSYSKGYVSHCELCGKDRYVDHVGADACEPCPPYETTLYDGSSRCYCQSGYYRNDNRTCTACPMHARCDLKTKLDVRRDSSDMTWLEETAVWEKTSSPREAEVEEYVVETLVVEKGYWRATNRSTRLRECVEKPEYCVGTRTNGSICAATHHGVFCMSCKKGYVDKGDGCVFCPDVDVDHDYNVLVTQSIGYGVPLLGFIGIWTALRSRSLVVYVQADAQPANEAKNRLTGCMKLNKKYSALLGVASSKLKILVGYAQILFSLGGVFALDLPKSIVAFTQSLSIIGADISIVLPFGCYVESNHYVSLLIATLTPIALVGLLVAAYAALWAMARYRIRKEHLATVRETLKAEIINKLLVITFAVYPSTSIVILKTFTCVAFEDGSNALKADKTLDCDSPSRAFGLRYAGVATLVYPVGIWLLYCVLVYRERKQLRYGKVVPYINFLTSSYEPEQFWFEPVELVRKLLQTVFVTFFFESEITQMVVTMILCVAFIGVFSASMPYFDQSDDNLAIVSQASLFFTSFAALLFHIANLESSAWGSADKEGGLSTAVLFAIIFAGPVMAVLGVVYAIIWVRNAFSAEERLKLLGEFETCENEIQNSLEWKNMEEKLQKEAIESGKSGFDQQGNEQAGLFWFQPMWLKRLEACIGRNLYG